MLFFAWLALFLSISVIALSIRLLQVSSELKMEVEENRYMALRLETADRDVKNLGKYNHDLWTMFRSSLGDPKDIG